MSLICPYIINCPIYKNWNEKTKEDRIDIIGELNGEYSCWALTASKHQLDSAGIFANKDLEKRMNAEANCSHIKLLNLLGEVLV